MAEISHSYTQRSRKHREPWRTRAVSILTSDRARFVSLACFLLLVALLGGGSRSDIQSLVILRPIAVLFAFWALFLLTASDARAVRVPLLVIVAFMALALLQLVPLPPAIWTGLPNRDLVAEASALIGMEDMARPLSLDPERTWNAFFAMFVPLAAIGLTAIQAPAYRRRIVMALAAVALLSAVLGYLQTLGGRGLHLYAITHDRYPVGLFSNRNHQSVMLLWLMLAASWLAASASPHRRSAKVTVASVVGLIVVLFPLLILTGSRAGLLLSVPTLALCGWLLLRSPAARSFLGRAGRRARIIAGAVAAALAAIPLSVLAVLSASQRNTALHRLFETDAADELRWSYLPTLLQMARDHLPFGSGFGSFENVFNIYEPADLLNSRYLNQAHNDLLQLVIEGGIPALLVLLAALAWFAGCLWQAWRSRGQEERLAALFFGGSIALWLAASLPDYPLRTPLAAALVAALTAQLSMLSTRARSIPGLPGEQGDVS